MPSPLVSLMSLDRAPRQILRRAVADDSNGRVTLSRSVEISEINSLPRTEHELASAHRKRHVVPRQYRFDVRVGVSLGVMELGITRDQLCEMCDEVVLHIGVGVLIHEDARCRVQCRYHADPVGHPRACDRRTHARGDVRRADLCLCRDVQRLVMNGHVRSPLSTMRPRGAPSRYLSGMRTRSAARADAIARLRTGADPATAALDADVLLAFALGVS